ncbi:MAG TPA: hypothetical protein VMT62_17415, partial [Syntrophorhabdaceae bacterium]|nr:hypothetical protein [Syntrophorhabdaceae bacterium]
SIVAGGFVGAGMTYNITKEFFLGLEGKYLWTTKASLSGSWMGIPVDTGFRIEGLHATLNIGYRF